MYIERNEYMYKSGYMNGSKYLAWLLFILDITLRVYINDIFYFYRTGPLMKISNSIFTSEVHSFSSMG